MINPILSGINETLDGYVKIYCLLERSESNKTIEYSGGGSFNTIPFDTYKVGGYWRLRSNVSFTEAQGPIACSKKQTITYPLYFVAWFRRDEVEDYDQFAQLTAGTISTLRTPSVRTQVRGYNIDQQQSETGKINDDWMVIRFDVDVVFTKICPTTCATVEPFCKLLGSINSVEIGEFFSNFNILVVNQDGEQTGAWNEETQRWEVVTGGGGDVTLQVNGSPFTVITAPDTFNLEVLQDGSPVGSKVGNQLIIPPCPDTTISLPQDSSTTTQDAGETLVFTVKDAAEVAFADSQVSVIVVGQDYAIILTDQFLRLNGVTQGVGFSRRLTAGISLQDPSAAAVAATLLSQTDNSFTFELAWAALSITGSGGTISWANYINGDAPDIDIVDSADNPVAITKISGTKLQIDDLPCAPSGLSVTISATPDATPTVGEEITITVTATGADSFCVWLGNGASISGNTAANNYTYYLPNIYTVQALAAIKATGVGGMTTAAQDIDITVAGILDTYGTAAVACAPFLLKREYAGDYIQVQRDSDSTNDLIPYVDAVADQDAITTFVGANNGGIRQIFSQVAGVTLEQTTFANMPLIVDSGTLIKDVFGIPTARFNGTTTRMTAANPAFWPADRTKLTIAFVAKCTNTASATNPYLAQYVAAGNQRGYVVFFDGASSRIALRWSNDGSALQTVYFDTTINELGFYFCEIDTSLTGNNRAKIWKTTANGTTQLTVNAGASSGNVGGNIHPSTGDLEWGSFNNGSSLFEGDSGGFVVDPKLYTSGERTAVQNYLQGIFNNYPS